MSSAKIEVRATDIGSAVDYYHLFIVYTVTDNSGHSIEYILRGGPSISNNSLGAAIPEVTGGSSGQVSGNPLASGGGRPYGDVVTYEGQYTSENKIDWDPSALRTTIIEGSQSQIETYFLALEQQMSAIDAAGYRYNPVQSNSNTTVFTALENVGLTPKLPKDASGHEVWAPGYNTNFKTPLEEVGDLIGHYGSEFGNWFDSITSDIFDTSSNAASKLIDILNPISSANASEFGNTSLINSAINNNLDYYSNTSFSKSFSSLGLDNFDLNNHSWSGLGSGNTFLDDQTFNFGGSGFTLFSNSDRITLPTFSGFGSSVSGGATDWKINSYLSDNVFGSFLDAQNRVSPLILDMNNNGIETTGLYDTKVFFDIDGDGFAEKVGWVKPTEGLLAIDTNGNGIIDDITELFGDDKMAAFDKLRKFDSNHDGKINSSDTDYSKLLVWQDLNTDGRADSGELKTLQAAGVKEISLTETKTDTYQNDNYISTQATFTKFDNSTAEIADVHFMNDNVNTWFMGAQSQVYGTTYEVDPETLLLPLSRGYGSLASLHIAMTNDPTLKGMMKEIVNLQSSKFNELADKVTAFMYQWAGVTDNDPTSRRAGDGNNIDSRMVDFIEKFTGVKWEQMGTSSMVGEKAALIVKQVWGQIAEMLTSRILVQGTLAEIFPHARYDFKTDSMTLGDSMANIINATKTYITEHNLSGDAAHELWLDLGNILIDQKTELHTDIPSISSALDTASGQHLFISDITLTSADGDVYSVKADKNGHYPDEHLSDSVYVGTAADDTITGSNHNDYIFGKDGNNHLIGGAGDDFLRGGIGTDHIEGGIGDDRLEGGTGNDLLEGGDGRDDIHGGAGNDTLIGGAGDDRLEGDAGADIIEGGAGVNEIAYLDSTAGVYVNLATHKNFGGYAEGDTFTNIQNIDGSDHDDVLFGDAGDNLINGEKGNDVIHGGGGNDHLFGAEGNDSMYGEAGNDLFDGFDGAELMDGGTGEDTVNYSHPYNKGGVYVNLATGEGHWNAAEGDKYVSIEDATGTNSDDVIIGNSGNNILYGLKGNDVIYGGAGDDTLISGGGIDWLIGGSGRDKFVITPDVAGTVYIKDFNPAEDTIDYSNFTSDITSATEITLAPSGNDTIISIEGKYLVFVKDTTPAQFTTANFLGSATLHNLNIATHINGGVAQTGDDYGNQLVGTIDNDTINGAGGDDSIVGWEGNDNLSGGEGNDRFVGGDGADSLNGGNGTDTIDYQDSYEGVNINLASGAASGGTATGDTFSSIENVEASKFNDNITGNNQANYLFGNSGDDRITGGGGADIMEGGQGNDIFVISVDPNVTSAIADFDINNPNEKIDLTAFGNLTNIQIIANNNAGYATLKLPNGQNVNTPIQQRSATGGGIELFRLA